MDIGGAPGSLREIVLIQIERRRKKIYIQNSNPSCIPKFSPKIHSPLWGYRRGVIYYKSQSIVLLKIS